MPVEQEARCAAEQVCTFYGREISPLPGIEPQYLDCVARSSVAVLTALSRHLLNIMRTEWEVSLLI